MMRTDKAGCRRVGVWLQAVALALVLTVVFPNDVWAQDNEELLVPDGQQIAGDVATIERDIVVEGEVLGDVTSWSGSIRIIGHVTGDVVSYGGPVVLDDAAWVEGNVLVLSGKLNQAQGARVVGQVMDNVPVSVQVAASVLDFARQPGTTPIEGLGYALLGFGLILVMLFLTIGSMVFWPRRVAATSYTLAVRPYHSLLVGILTTLLLTGVYMLISMVLALTLVGIPLILPLLLLINLPHIYGLFVVSQSLGHRLAQRLWEALPLGMAVIWVLGVLLAILFVVTVSPVIGGVLFYTLASAGVGAVILSRGGTGVPATRANET